VRSVNLTGAPRELKPIVAAIDDWNRNWRLGVIFECAVGPGKLLVSAIPLNTETSPGAQSLAISLRDYAASDQFKPAAKLTPEQARALWTSDATSGKPADRAFDADLDDGTKRPKPR
jgi:hypothetical protein